MTRSGESLRGAEQRAFGWRSALRGGLLFLYLAAAGLEEATYENTVSPGASLAENLVIGVLLAALLLFAVATVAHIFRRWRVSRGQATARPFRGALVSVPVLLAAFLIAAAVRAGAETQAQQEHAHLAASDAVSNNPRDRERGALAAFMTSLPTSELPLARALRGIKLMTNEVKSSTPNLELLVADARVAVRDSRAFASAVAAEPAATSAVRELKGLHQKAAGLLVQATTDYLRGFETRSVQVLRNGDSRLLASVAALRATAQRGDALYQELGGYGQFGKRIDLQALEQTLRDANGG